MALGQEWERDKKMQIVIVDDDPVMGKQLAEHTERLAKANGIEDIQITYLENGEKLLEDDKIYQMYFLDIELEGMNGIELAKRLRQQKIFSPFVFVSSYDKYVWEIFPAGPQAYIRKGHMQEDMASNLPVLFYEFSRKKKCMLLKCGSEKIKIYPDEIIYFQSVEHYIKIIDVDCEAGPVLLRSKMSAVEKQLIEYDFFRIHERYLVNIKYIKKLNRNELLLMDGTILPVSRKYKKSLQISIHRWMKK